MLLSSSVIKNTKVVQQGNREIVTSDNNFYGKQSLEALQQELRNSGNTELENLDKIGVTIMDSAKKAAEDIKREAIIESEKVKSEAFKSGHDEGFESGKQEGYNAAYNETYAKGKIEVENFKNLAEANASNLINSAKHHYEKYLLEKEEEIKKLAFAMASQILKREVAADNGITSMIHHAVEQCKNSKLVIIKCNKLHFSSVDEALVNWKRELPINGDTFVIEDNLLEDDAAIIEKGNGKIKLSISIGLDSLKEELQNN